MNWETELVEKLSAAENGGKQRVIEEYAALTGKSERALWNVARKNGYKTERKERADKGKHTVTMEQLDYVSTLMAVSARENKGVIMSVATALEIAEDNGVLEREQISASRLSTLLRQYNKHKAALDTEDPHSMMRSLFPNHVHQVDVSACIQWFIDDKGMGERDEIGLHKNKLKNFKKIKQQLLRYTMTDHASGSVFVRYYYAAGENQKNLFDFCLHAWAFKNDKYPFRGVPYILMMDKGSANTSRAFLAFLERLGVEVPEGMPGNKRRQGSVERHHLIVETQFESRLRFNPAASLEQLNAWATDWAAYFNAVKTHSRHGMTRTAAWLKIPSAKLRELPDRELLQDLFANPEESRKVNGTYKISYRGNTYNVHHIPDLSPGESVAVVLRPFDFPVIGVRYNGAEYVAAPLAKDEFGFSETSATIGKEYKAVKTSSIQKHKQRIEEIARPNGEKVPFGGGLTVFGHQTAKLAENTHYIPKKGSVIELSKEDVPEKRMPIIQALKRVREAIGRLTPEQNTKIREQYGAEISDADLNALIERMQRGGDEQTNVKKMLG